MDNLMTSEQMTALWKFRNNIQDIIKESHDDDRYLLKWLKARNYDPEKAETMYRKSMQWRQLIGADTLLSDWEPPKVLKKFYAGGPGGYTKDGYLVWFDLASHMDFKGLLRACKKSDIVKYEAYQIEKAQKISLEQSKKLGRMVDQVVVVLDLSQLGIKHLSGPHLSVFTAILEMTEANYPENLKACYIINAPKIFPLAFNLAKPFLAEETRQKIFVFGSNYQEALLKIIEPDQLPAMWGGTWRDSETQSDCPSQICLGGEVHPSFVFQNPEINSAEMSVLTVDRAKCERLAYKIEEADSLLRWEFITDKYDIRFGVFFSESEVCGNEELDQLKSLTPFEKVNSHQVTQDGTLHCSNIGTYILVFDNRYSWVTNKTVQYKVEVDYSAVDVSRARDPCNNDIHRTSVDDQLVTIDL